MKKAVLKNNKILEAEIGEAVKVIGASVTEFARRAIGSREYRLISAIRKAGQGEPARLINYLRSDEPLSADFRYRLASMLEGQFSKKAGRGRPRDIALHGAADEAELRYQFWIGINRREGVSDHGDREAMKTECIAEAAKIYRVDAERVRDLMDRPKSRRK